MAKHIKFSAVTTPGSNFQTVTVTLLQQTDRGFNFGEFGRNFFTSNSITLKSVDCPEVREYSSTIYLRGAQTYKDSKELVMSVAAFAKFKKAVEAYNALFAAPAPAPVVKVTVCAVAPCITVVG